MDEQFYEWETTVSPKDEDAISKGQQLLETYKDLELHHPIMQSDLSYKHIDMLNKFCMTVPTMMCYQTNGGLTKKGRLLFAQRDWNIQPFYKKSLTEFAKIHCLEYNEVALTDICLRMKNARGFKWIVVKSDLEPETGMLFIVNSDHWESHRISQGEIPVLLKLVCAE